MEVTAGISLTKNEFDPPVQRPALGSVVGGNETGLLYTDSGHSVGGNPLAHQPVAHPVGSFLGQSRIRLGRADIVGVSRDIYPDIGQDFQLPNQWLKPFPGSRIDLERP